MKITKSADKALESNRRREEANNGCDKCPNCGKPSVACTFKSWFSLFRAKHYRIDCYTCDECGCEWESEKYECEVR